MAEIEQPPWLLNVKGTQVIPLITSDNPRLRVEAGPGTGKTFGLVKRLFRILHPDGLAVPGKEVLVIAFNRVIAQQLTTDISTMMKALPSGGGPVIRTVHALCLELIGEGMRLLLPHEVEMMLYDVLQGSTQIAAAYAGYDEAAQALRDHEAKHADHPVLWQACDQWLVRHKARLISDLPGLLLDAIQGGDFSDRKFSHIVVDEYQDLTDGEQKIVVALLKPGGSVVALGDPRQSIYKFRGNDRYGLAKLETILGGNVTDLPMTECQRCPTDVVEAANRLMGLYAAQPMIPTSGVTANTHVVHWTSPQAEADGIAAAIVANVQAFPQERHLVMVTRRIFGYKLRDKLATLAPDIAVDLSFVESPLETWPVREAFLFFCLVVDPDAPTWRAWLGYQNSADGKNYKAGKRNAEAYLNLLTANTDIVNEAVLEKLLNKPSELKGAGRSNVIERAQRYFDLKKRLGGDTEDAVAFLTTVFSPNEWIAGQVEDAATAKNDLQFLSDQAKSLLEEYVAKHENVCAGEALKATGRYLRYSIAVRDPIDNGDTSAVKITTMWSAKGVTAEHVYIVGLCDPAIPGERKLSYPGTDDEFREEQRRLFYVSITRPKRTLVLSRARMIKWGDGLKIGFKGIQRGSQMELRMSPFLRDIIQYLPVSVDGKQWQGCVPEPTPPLTP